MKLDKKYYLLIIVAVAIIIRLYFYIGHIFSDDAYYSYLSYTLLKGDFAKDYLGYPIFSLRIVYLLITAFTYKIFGVNEFATILFPFILSIANLIVIYKIAKIFSENENVSIISSLLMAFFPTDVVFATISFVDLPNTFFINLGIYFLYKSYKSGKILQASTGGIFFFASMQIKENIVYTALLLILLLVFLFIKKKRINVQIAIGLGFIIFNTFLEGFIYLFLHSDFFYRFSVLNQNYSFSYYDFFPYTAQKLSGVKNFWRNIFDQIFLINCKSIFIRRFYLFTPLIAAFRSIFNLRKKEHALLTYWFLGTAILLIAFTTSFAEYKPLDLQRSWYIYPLLIPTIILTSLFINNFKKNVKFFTITVYITFGIIICTHYEGYFNIKDISPLKSFLERHKTEKIFSDHFTKYSVDLLRNYSDETKSERIAGENFNLDKIKKGNWIIFNQKHIDELKWQGFDFPDFAILSSGMYSKLQAYGDFIIYEKVQ